LILSLIRHIHKYFGDALKNPNIWRFLVAKNIKES